MRIMSRLVLCLVIVTVVLVSCSQRQVSEADLLATLDTLAQKFEWLDHQYSLQYWEMYTAGKADSMEFYQGLRSDLVNDQDLLNQLQVGKNLLTNEEDQRRRDLFLFNFLYGRVEDDPEIFSLRDSLSSININYRAEFEGEKRSSGYLYKISRYDSNRRRRETAFRAWSSISDQVSDGLGQLFRLRNQKARRLGYNSFMALVFNQCGLDLNEYKTLLDKLNYLSEERYLEILDRNKAKLNVDEMEAWDLSYAYSDINKAVDRYFPADSQLIYIKRSLKAIDLDIDKLPIYFDLESREGKAQYAYTFVIKPPHDVRVLGNQTDGFYSTMVLLHEIGHAVHYTNITQDRDIFVRNVDGCWTEGMAQIAAGMLKEKQWLETYAKMPPQLVDSYLASLKEQEIQILRRRLVLYNFEYEAYKNPNRDINKLYWDIVEKQLHVPRHEDLKPWAGIGHYVSIPIYLQNYLYADMIAAQTYDFLRENYGSITDNPKVSAFLVQNYYRFGARYDWRELIQRGTDEDLNPEHLIKQLGL
ncbi:MAG: M3 family metallopeptidase [candidate division Zixibacteria bacterium]